MGGVGGEGERGFGEGGEGVWGEEEEVVFEVGRGGDTNAHYELEEPSY